MYMQQEMKGTLHPLLAQRLMRQLGTIHALCIIHAALYIKSCQYLSD